jgi:ABC-type Mn2+/Zn2+ transport system ATPase subunit
VTAVATVAPAALIEARTVAVGRGTPLLRAVTFALRPGECWFLLGRNGSGKSTLIHALLGLLAPLGGEIRRAAAIADRSGLGYVPQEQRFPASLPLTVSEFVDLGLAGSRLKQGERQERAAAALEAMHVADLAARNSGSLSFGQRRRVLAARALARRPSLLVLDEPTAGLDPFSSGQLARDLEQQRKSAGLCMLHASHDVELARAYATHVALVADGGVRTGAAAAVFGDPATGRVLGLGGGA